MFIDGFLDPCDAEFQGEQGTAVMGEVLRSGGRGGLQAAAFEGTFLPFSSLPLIALPLEGCIIKNSRHFIEEVFCPSALLPQKSPLKMTA